MQEGPSFFHVDKKKRGCYNLFVRCNNFVIFLIQKSKYVIHGLTAGRDYLQVLGVVTKCLA